MELQTTPLAQSPLLECLIGDLIGGQEELLQALGVADISARGMQPRPSAVVRRITERRQLGSLIATARGEASLLISDYNAIAPYPKVLLAQILDLLERRVTCRALLNPGVRKDASYLEWARQARSLGGEVRWITEEFKPMILVDSKSALILDGSGSAGALLITEPTLVAVLARVFGNLWNGAQRLTDSAPVPQGLAKALTSTRESIIDMLITGHPDKTIAKHLGISLRSVQAHVATLREELGANTRAQLGYLLARAGKVGTAGPSQTSQGNRTPLRIGR